MLRTKVEISRRLTRGQDDRQQQLCVPPVLLTGDSYRTRQRRELLAKDNRAGRA